MTIPSLSIDPFDEHFLADPYVHHDALRDSAPVVWLEPIGAYAIAQFEPVQAALKDWQSYVSGRGVGLADFAKEEPWRPPSILLEADPPLHDRARALMNRIVSLPAIKAAASGWRDRANEIVGSAIDKRHCDAVADVAEAFPLAIFPDMIGLRDDGREHLLPYAANVFNSFGPNNRILRETLASSVEARAWGAESCKREHLKPGGWGMAIHEAADRGDCTVGEAELLNRAFLSAGFDTTVNGIANMIHAFAQNPDQWQRLRAEPALAKKAFEESLRWDGTVQTFFRTTSCDTTVAGETIPEGSKVLLFLAAANRDPRHWDRADQFDITRSTSGHVGFGFGIHQCLGQMVARTEAESVLSALIPRVAEIRLTGPVERRLNNTLHAVSKLPVEFVPA